MIEIEGVAKQFGGIQAVHNCSFRMEPGQITGLIGPNGAGKTTLFNIIAGFIRPTAGHIILDGVDITGLPPQQLFHQGLVRTFQIPHEVGRMTVLENLMLVPAQQLGENLLISWFGWSRVKHQEQDLRQRAERVLERLKLIHLRDQLASTLSGGQKKLLELGRTMMTDAKVILLDEPAAGVNRTLLGDLATFIEDLNAERGCTFCIIEHDLDLISRLCDHVVVMAQGTVLTQGTMAQVKRDPTVREAYLGAMDLQDALPAPDPKQAVAQVKSVAPVKSVAQVESVDPSGGHRP
ncbi:MAG: ABC transporter ATP-binding protein [Synechococcaceae cyanobacterium SM2_3_2]|nr:ABC transporter ATP-binding protein [Synechococcaceae cyanobacterium SM2_3_2]